MLPAEVLRAIAIMLALLAAVGLALGAQFQNDSVHQRVSGTGINRLGVKQVLGLLKRPRWLVGTAFLMLGVVLQLAALTLAPLIVVQPIGAVALIITSLLNAKIYGVRLGPRTFFAIALTLAGISSFVVAAAGVANEAEMSDEKLLQVLGVLALMLILFGFLMATLGGNAKALNYVFGAGVLYGFVATLAKVIIQRLIQGDFDNLTLSAAIALALAAMLGGWFVQNAYATGPPDLVIAGLTVIDPMVAVGIGIVILGEASEASFDVIMTFIGSGLVAVLGVYLLEKVHPQSNEN
ncbi:MAG: DMT family transporter [Microbacteriaceae bacterium]|nr:DMT family transporter [Microbacteriaceae bacterium]